MIHSVQTGVRERAVQAGQPEIAFDADRAAGNEVDE